MSIWVSSHTHTHAPPNHIKANSTTSRNESTIINSSHCLLWQLHTFLSLTKTSKTMFLMFKIVLVYMYLLYGIAMHGSCTSNCTCEETCADPTADQPAMPCLYHADHATLTAGRQIKWVDRGWMCNAALRYRNHHCNVLCIHEHTVRQFVPTMPCTLMGQQILTASLKAHMLTLLICAKLVEVRVSLWTQAR